MNCHSTLPVGIKGKYMSATPMGHRNNNSGVGGGYELINGCFYPVNTSYYSTKGYFADGYSANTGEIICQS